MSAGLWNDIIVHLTLGQRNIIAKVVDLSSPPDFFEYTRSLFPSPGIVTPVGRSLIRNLVIAWGVLLPGLSRDQALEIADQAQRVTAFDTQLMHILGEDFSRPGRRHINLVLRGLDVVDHLGPTSRLLMPLTKFLRYPSPQVRSKAAKIVGRITSNKHWIDQYTTELDPRVRSNLLEAIVQNHALDEIQLRDILNRAARDKHRRVRVTALYLLARMGDQSSLEQLHALQQDEDPTMRKSADWAVAQLDALKPGLSS